MLEKIKQDLNSLATIKLRDFQAKLIPNSLPILGVKIPDLRKYAKRLCKEDYELFLKEYDASSFELQLLYAYVISTAKMDFSIRINYLRAFIPTIIDWAVCDGLVSSLKITKDHLEEVFNFLMEFKDSHNEFEVRFVAVMLMSYYLNDTYVCQAIQIIQALDLSTYYAKMGAAWFIATLMIDYNEEAFKMLEETKDVKLVQFTIRKARDSYRISNENKDRILQYKNK